VYGPLKLLLQIPCIIIVLVVNVSGWGTAESTISMRVLRIRMTGE